MKTAMARWVALSLLLGAWPLGACRGPSSQPVARGESERPSSASAPLRAAPSLPPSGQGPPVNTGLSGQPAPSEQTELNEHPAARDGAKLVAASEHTWRYPDTAFGRIDVVVRVPAHASNARLPLLIAFHGRGESLKGPERGARGWLDDYRLERAATRLSHPPLTSDDFGGLVTQQHLDELNRELKLEPYSDLVVAMPYLPDVLKRESVFSNGPVLARFLAETLLPRLRAELPVAPEPRHTGIDGVSLGGRASLVIGFTLPEQFGSVAAMQPAIDEKELSHWVELAVRARRRNPGLALRLLSSNEDYYREVVTEFARELDAASVKHRFDLVSGDHSYAFNRGPGGIEMLLYHARELRRAQPTTK